MKLSLPLLAAAAQANTLLAPLYEGLASQVVNQVSGLLSAAEALSPISTTPALLSAVQNFNTALQGMDQSALVAAMASVDISTLVDADGNFNSDALVTIFTSLDPTVVQSVQDEFVNAMLADATFGTQINTAMTAFTDFSTVFGDIMNNDIQWSNFVALFNDFTDGLVSFNAAFDNALLGNSMDAFLTYSGYISRIAEKALVVYEQADDLRISYRNANTLIQFGIEDRLNEAGHTAGDSIMCTAGTYGVFNTLIEIVDFIPDVLITNLDVPVTSTVEMWDDFVHGLPYVSNYEIGKANLDAFGAFWENSAASVSGSLTEISVLAAPFSPQINSAVRTAFC